MNRKDANPAVMHVRILKAIHTVETERCSKPLAHLVAKLAKSRLSPAMIVLYIAAIALQTEDNINLVLSALRKRRTFSFLALAIRQEPLFYAVRAHLAIATIVSSITLKVFTRYRSYQRHIFAVLCKQITLTEVTHEPKYKSCFKKQVIGVYGLL
jgi:hypothetical protein